MDDLEVNTARVQVEGLLDTLRDAKEYGSILKVESYNWELLRRFVSAADAGEQITLDSTGLEGTVERLLTLIDIAETMAQKYDVVVTNPPYMAVSNGGAKTQRIYQKNYPDSKGRPVCRVYRALRCNGRTKPVSGDDYAAFLDVPLQL